MKKRFLTAAAALAAAAVFGGRYLVHERQEAERERRAETLSRDAGENLAGNYLAARHAAVAGDNGRAAEYLSKALRFDPRDLALMNQAVGSNLLSGDFDRAVEIARNEEKTLQPLPPLTALVLFTDDIRRDEWDRAGARLNELRSFGLQAVSMPFLKSWVGFAQNKQVVPPQPIAGLKHNFYQSFLNFQSALLYDQAGDADQAAVYYDLSLGDPAVLPQRFVSVAMQFYLRQGNGQRALDIYRRYQEANPDNISVQIVPADAVIAELKSYGLKPMVSTPAAGVGEVLFVMATLLHGESVEREALEYARMALALTPDLPSGQMLIGDILEDSEKPEAALAAYEQVPETSLLYRRAVLRRSFLLNQLNRRSEAFDLLAKAGERIARPADLKMAEGDLLRESEQYPDAARAYTEALTILGEPKSFQWPIYYTRGISYEQAGRWDKAEQDFQTALTIKPDQPDVVNYLAYSWLLQGKNIEKATAMLEQVVANRPDDGHIVDSLAWAYSVTGRYDLALEYIEQAIELMPADATVNDHYGDILWRVGRRNEARYQWKRALIFKPDAAEIEKINLKLQSGLPEAKPVAAAPVAGTAPATSKEAMAQSGT